MYFGHVLQLRVDNTDDLLLIKSWRFSSQNNERNFIGFDLKLHLLSEYYYLC